METDKPWDIAIVGAGIVGLATAYQLLQKRPDLRICLFEKEKEVGCHQTGRNSGVVHTGVYYKPGSLKARNCLAGRSLLLRFCEEEGILYKKKEKLIVATSPKEFGPLEEIFSRGKANGVPGVRLLSSEELREKEPHCNALKALLVPHCHIVDFKKVALRLAEKIQEKGGKIVYGEKIQEILREKGGVVLVGENRFFARFAINCAGLHSDRLAKNASPHQIVPFRGEYYTIRKEKQKIVNSLIYPVPNPEFPFLGVHLTEMANGALEAGPNAVLAFAREGYRGSDFVFQDVWQWARYSGFWKMALRYWKAGCYEMARSWSKRLFLKDLQKLVPSLTEEDLLPGGSGVRAQVVTKEGRLLDDFAFAEEENILHVLNAPSPAATASFAIGAALAEKVLFRTSPFPGTGSSGEGREAGSPLQIGAP